MSATTLIRHSGNHDFQLGEQRNARQHTYDTLAHANADASNANNRICFVEETNRFYMGRSNIWIKIESIGNVDVPANLPNDETNGALYVVNSDPAFNNEPNIYVLESDTWYSIRDNKYPTSIITRSTTGSLTSARRLLVKLDTAAAVAEFNLTVPATAVAGDEIIFKDIGGQMNTKPVFLVPGSQTIDGLSSNLELNRKYQCLKIQYIEGHWMVMYDA